MNRTTSSWRERPATVIAVAVLFLGLLGMGCRALVTETRVRRVLRGVLALPLVSLALAGCIGGTEQSTILGQIGETAAPVTQSAAPTPAETPAPPAAKAIHLHNTLKSGASAEVKLAARSYKVTWDASDGSDSGCSWFLFLTTMIDGPTIAQIASAIFPDSKGHTGSAVVKVKKAGVYIVEEDESGMLSCHRLWSADLTPN